MLYLKSNPVDWEHAKNQGIYSLFIGFFTYKWFFLRIGHYSIAMYE